MVHLYGPGQDNGGGGGGGGSGKGPPPGKGKNKIAAVSTAQSPQIRHLDVVYQAAFQKTYADATSPTFAEDPESFDAAYFDSQLDEPIVSIATRATEKINRSGSDSDSFDLETSALDEYFALLWSQGELGRSFGLWPDLVPI